MALATTRTQPARRDGNGGFPEPPAGTPVRVVRCEHAACGAETRIRLPEALPAAAVHRVVCEGCHESFDPVLAGSTGQSPLGALGDAALNLWDGVLDARDAAAERLGSFDRAQLWTWASIPIAALAVVAGLALLQGGSEDSTPSLAVPKAAREAGQAEYVRGAGFSLALPHGWKETNPPDGAAFAASAPGGRADATLWIEEDPELSFREFEQRSLAQLGEIADNPRIVDRVQGPTVETTITELRADAPVADGVTAPVRVTLRGAGNYRYYFSTVLQPDADAQTAADIETLHASLRPDVAVEGLDDTGSP
jgi:hypothetical protein